MATAEIMLSDGRAVIYDGPDTWTLQVGDDEPKDAKGLNLSMWLQGIGPGIERDAGIFPYGELYDFMTEQQAIYSLVSEVKGVIHTHNDQIRDLCLEQAEKQITAASEDQVAAAVKIMRSTRFGIEYDPALAPEGSHVARLLAMI